MPELKAYLVTEPHEDLGDIVFAKSDIEARVWGANEYNEGELKGMTVRRARELDGLQHDLRAITRGMLKRGWEFNERAHSLEKTPHIFVDGRGITYENWSDWLAETQEGILKRVAARSVH